jgi:putative inorganic carbon (hco3(-)) transporter
MRDLLIGGLILYFTLRALTLPWVGVMLWTVVGIMNPHKLSWRVDQMPVAMGAAVATLLGMLVSRDPKRFPLTRETVLFVLLMVWFTVTWLASGAIGSNYESWLKVMKIDFMLLIALLVLHSRVHLMCLAWAVVGSIAFYGVKGGVFTIATGGSYRVWGPPTTYIEGNNELALALIVCIPLLRFLQLQMRNRWLRHAMTASMLLCAAAALGSHSRGALLAIVAMALVMWWRSDKKFLGGVFMLVFGLGLVAFMPDHWTQRMNTIDNYQEDESAMGRINAWIMCFNLANNHFFGGSFNIYNALNFKLYSPNPEAIHAAHSIYFQILGEHGWVGLTLYLMLWICVFLSAGRLRKRARGKPETQWLSDMGAMCQVSLAGFAVGGAFLSLAYFDLPYNVMVLVVLGDRWMATQAWKQEQPLPPGYLGVVAHLLGVSGVAPKVKAKKLIPQP